MRLRPTAILPIVALLVAGACSTGSGSRVATTTTVPVATTTSSTEGGSSGVSDSSTTIPAIKVPVLQWAACGESLECTNLVVPLDYS